jgi:4-aminobutyrate aminotransferase/(S)-3-amino-2-methylpropionate transaminase
MCCVKEICDKLKKKKTKAIIFEPIQGAGVIIPPQGFWQEIYEFCKENKIIMFADEVLTAGGRTGYFLASYGYYNITPDIISITKGLANGRPLSVLCQREFITDNQYAKRKQERSSTFASHPTNMAVATKCLELIEKENILANVRTLGNTLANYINKLKDKYENLGDSRSIGLMAGLEFVNTKKDKIPNYELCQKIFERARYNGLETIQSGNILRLAPPLNITKKDLLKGLDIIENSIKESI